MGMVRQTHLPAPLPRRPEDLQDCTRQYGSSWYRRNKEKINKKRRARYPQNRAWILEQMRKRCRARNPYGP
jgi:hypothetical protein